MQLYIVVHKDEVADWSFDGQDEMYTPYTVYRLIGVFETRELAQSHLKNSDYEITEVTLNEASQYGWG